MPISDPGASHVPGWRHFRLTAASFAHLDNFQRRNIHSPCQARTNYTAVWRQKAVEFLNQFWLPGLLVIHLLMFLWSSSICSHKLVLSKIRTALLWEKQKVGWLLFATEEIRDWTQNENRSRQFLTNCLNQAAAPTFQIAPEQSHSPQ